MLRKPLRIGDYVVVRLTDGNKSGKVVDIRRDSFIIIRKVQGINVREQYAIHQIKKRY